MHYKYIFKKAAEPAHVIQQPNPTNPVHHPDFAAKW
jgi:hypothetical protein